MAATFGPLVVASGVMYASGRCFFPRQSSKLTVFSFGKFYCCLGCFCSQHFPVMTGVCPFLGVHGFYLGSVPDISLPGIFLAILGDLLLGGVFYFLRSSLASFGSPFPILCYGCMAFGYICIHAWACSLCGYICILCGGVGLHLVYQGVWGFFGSPAVWWMSCAFRSGWVASPGIIYLIVVKYCL